MESTLALAENGYIDLPCPFKSDHFTHTKILKFCIGMTYPFTRLTQDLNFQLFTFFIFIFSAIYDI